MNKYNIEVHTNYDQIKQNVRSLLFGIVGGLIVSVIAELWK